MKISLQVLLICFIVFSCSKDPDKVIPSGISKFGNGSNSNSLELRSCKVSYSIDESAKSLSLPYKSWINDVISDFTRNETYLKFEENTNQATTSTIHIQFLDKENFLNTESQGVFSFPIYSLTRVDSSYISLNSHYDWTESLVKKAIAYHLGQMLALSYDGSDSESIMNPEYTKTYLGLSTGDLQQLKSKFDKNLLSANITKGFVSPRSISVSWNINVPNNFSFRGSGLCWSSANSNPNINDQKTFISATSGNLSTNAYKPGSTIYYRSYFITDCETIYSPVLKIIIPQVNTWEAGTPVPFSSRTGASVVTNEGMFGKAFVIGGRTTSNNELTNEVWMHQPSLNLWKQVKSFPGIKRESATIFVYQDKIYYGLGYIEQNFTYPTDWWEYNIVSDTWSQKLNASPVGRPGALGFSTSSGGIITLGLNTPTATINLATRLYNNSNDSWTSLSNFPLISGVKGYCTNNDNPYVLTPSNRFFAFSNSGKYWFEAASFPFENPSISLGTQQNTMVSGQGKIYYGSKNQLDWYQYSPTTNTWAKKTNSPAYFTTSSMMYSIGDKVYVLDGSSKQVWEYNLE